MSIITCKCTRCKNVHDYLQRVGKPNVKHGWTDMVCPKCGCREFYDQTQQEAWAWASGLIQIGAAAPKDAADGSGAIKIASGPKSELTLAITTLARRSYQSQQLLVPGVPEAASQREAVDALSAWLRTCAGHKSKRWPGVVWVSKGGA